MATAVPYPVVPPRAKSDLPPLGPGALAGIGQRFLGRLLDGVVIGIPLYFLTVAPYIVESGSKKVISMDQPGWAQAVDWLVPVLYETIALMMFGTTIGKWIARCRVVRYSDGGLPQPAQAAFRTLVPTLPSLVALVVPSALGQFLGILPPFIYLTALFDPVYRGLNDKAGGTIVLRTR